MEYLKSNLDCDISGYTNLHIATLKEDIDKLTEILRDPHVDVNCVDIYDYYTPLIYAVKKNNSAMVEKLLSREDINIYQTDAYNMAPMDYMKQFSGEEVSNLLSSKHNELIELKEQQNQSNFFLKDVLTLRKIDFCSII